MAPASAKQTLAPLLGFDLPDELENADATSISARDHREGERFSDADLSGVDLSSAEFIECELSDLTLTETQLRGARFVDTLVSASFAPVLLAARTTWRRSRIENPRWGSAELFDASLDTLHVRGGKIDFLNLRGSQLTNVLFEGCTITELDLGGFRGNRVAFANCRIETLDATRANCTNVDLRTSDFARVNGVDGLRGATLDESQLMQFASTFASHLGVRIE
jgi:uncharacterized protein YjbI with pentapeptide repeats